MKQQKEEMLIGFEGERSQLKKALAQLEIGGRFFNFCPGYLQGLDQPKQQYEEKIRVGIFNLGEVIWIY